MAIAGKDSLSDSPSALAPDTLLALCCEAEQAAERYEIQAREAVRGLIAPEGKVDPRPAGARAVCGPWLRLDRDLCRGAAPDAPMGRGARYARRVRRAGAADRADGLWRVSRPALGRHRHQPGRDRAAGRSRHRRQRARRAGRSDLDRRQHVGSASAPRRAHFRRPRHGRFWRARPRRRGARRGPPPVPPLRRFGSGAARPWLASARRADPAAGGREDGRARRLRPHRAGGVGRPGHGQARHVRGHRGIVARLYRRRARWARARRSPPS